MAKLYIAFLLDFFQPALQSYRIIEEVTKECYLPMVELFNSDWNPKFTISMTHSLIHLLQECGRDEVIKESLKKAVDKGKLEIIHSGAHHSIFPLIPEGEVKRQIELDIQFKKDYFGITTRSGILSPELCYDDNLINLFKNFEFSWTILDDQVMEMNKIDVPVHEIYHIDNFYVFMRSAFWSNRITKEDNNRYWTGKKFVEYLKNEISQKNRDCYKIIALSGETFGHHVKYYQETFLRDMLFALQGCDSVKLCLVSELLKIDSLHKIEKSKEINKDFTYFPPSSWATTPEDAMRGDHYPHWKSNGNPIHAQLWKLTNLILETCQNINFDNNSNNDLRRLLDQAFYSCQYFWASIWFWNPVLIYEGIDLQMRALYKSARLTKNSRALEAGQRIYTQLMWEIFKRDQEKKKNKK